MQGGVNGNCPNQQHHVWKQREKDLDGQAAVFVAS